MPKQVKRHKKGFVVVLEVESFFFFLKIPHDTAPNHVRVTESDLKLITPTPQSRNTIQTK